MPVAIWCPKERTFAISTPCFRHFCAPFFGHSFGHSIWKKRRSCVAHFRPFSAVIFQAKRKSPTKSSELTLNFVELLVGPAGFGEPRPKNAPPGHFCQRDASAGTGCSNPAYPSPPQFITIKKMQPHTRLHLWLGRPDLNRRMEESKSSALPLGDGPL